MLAHSCMVLTIPGMWLSRVYGSPCWDGTPTQGSGKCLLLQQLAPSIFLLSSCMSPRRIRSASEQGGAVSCEACCAVRSQTCTLKSTADPSSPTTYSAAGDTDWVSGALTDLAAARAAKSQSRWISDCDTIPGGC